MDSIDLTDITILLVEDVAFNRRLICQLLNGLGRPEIHEAVDGKEALNILSSQEKHVDFVISDFNMPNYDGLKLLKAVRTGERGIDRQLPFAMLTAHSDVELVENALALDVNGFLIKPVSKGMLEQRIRQMLAQTVDTEWLRSVATYANIDVKTKVKLSPLTVEAHLQKSDRGIVTIRKDELLSGTVGELAAKPGRRRGSAQGGAKSRKGSRVPKLEPLKLPSLEEELADTEIKREVKTAVDEFVSETGDKVAGRVLSSLDGFVKKGVLAFDRLPDMLHRDDEAEEEEQFYEEMRGDWDNANSKSPREIEIPTAQPKRPVVKSNTRRVPGKLPAGPTPTQVESTAPDVGQLSEDSVSDIDIYTTEGDLIIEKGTVMTPRLMALVTKLDGLGALTTTAPIGGGVDSGRDDEGDDPTEIADADDSKAGAGELLCPLKNIEKGSLVARDITAANGNLLLASEQKITDKRLSMLEVAHDLGHISDRIWIKPPPAA